MDITERKVGDVTVVDVSGRMVVGEHSGRLKDKISSLMFQGERRVVLNLADVTYVDSSGLGEMVACHGTARRNGGEVKLANAGRRLHDLLVMTKLLTVFDTYDSEDEAVQSFAAAEA